MDRVGSGVLGNDAGAGNEGVDGGVEIETGISAWGMNEVASVAAAPMFAAIIQSEMGGLARLNDEGEGSSMVKVLDVGCTPKEVEGGGLDGANIW